jgi:hypothetical protein
MADGGLTLKIDAALGEQLRAAARAAGRPVDEYASGLLSDGLRDEWSTSLERLAEYDRTGEFYPADQVFAEVRQIVADRLAALQN